MAQTVHAQTITNHGEKLSQIYDNLHTRLPQNKMRIQGTPNVADVLVHTNRHLRLVRPNTHPNQIHAEARKGKRTIRKLHLLLRRLARQANLGTNAIPLPNNINTVQTRPIYEIRQTVQLLANQNMTQKEENMNNTPYVKLSISPKYPMLQGIALSYWETYYDVKTNCYVDVRQMDNNFNMDFKTFMKITARVTKQTSNIPPYILRLKEPILPNYKYFLLMNFVIFRLGKSKDFQQLLNNEISICTTKQTTT